MLSRRELLAAGMSLPAASLLLCRGLTDADQATRLIVVDTALPGAASVARTVGAGGATVHRFRSDAGGVWMHALEPALRSQPAAIGGYTAARTRFCLDYLARAYGLRLQHCAAAGSGNEIWLLTPDWGKNA